MVFGDRVRLLRAQSAMTQQQLADRMGVSVSYISKVENGRLHSGDFPSEKFIHKLSVELAADEDELLMLAEKVPASIRSQIRQRPNLFRKITKLDDASLDELESSLDATSEK